MCIRQYSSKDLRHPYVLAAVVLDVFTRADSKVRLSHLASTRSSNVKMSGWWFYANQIDCVLAALCSPRLRTAHHLTYRNAIAVVPELRWLFRSTTKSVCLFSQLRINAQGRQCSTLLFPMRVLRTKPSTNNGERRTLQYASSYGVGRSCNRSA